MDAEEDLGIGKISLSTLDLVLVFLFPEVLFQPRSSSEDPAGGKGIWDPSPEARGGALLGASLVLLPYSVLSAHVHVTHEDRLAK